MAPLKYDHKGARNADGKLEFLPHVGNLSRNVIVRSENPQGTRGHTIFISRANVDLRYVQFSDLGRTKMGVLSSTEFDSDGLPVRLERIRSAATPFTSTTTSGRSKRRPTAISSR